VCNVDWHAETDTETINRRAGGRRRYNAWRGFKRAHRHRLVVQLLRQYGMLKHGVNARIARELGVSKSTITRDVQALLDSFARCPCCGYPVPQ